MFAFEEKNRGTQQTYFQMFPWLSTFLMRQPFNTVRHVVVISNRKIISLLLHNYSFAAVMNSNVNT